MYDPIIETIEHKRRGDEYQFIGPCPFCGAYKPGDTRVYYNFRKGVGLCHHCSIKFNLVNYISKLNGISKLDAMKLIKNEESGYVRTEIKIEESKIYVPKNLIPICESLEASDYCASRGITKEIIDRFGLQYIPNHETIDGVKHYVGKRIYIPVTDSDGGLAFWQARDITGMAKNKYLFPKGMNKAQYVYNLHAVQKGAKYAILCEGIMDVFGWIKANKMAVALFGKYMSNEQYNLIMSCGIKTIYVALDQDAIKYSIDIQKRLGQSSTVKFIKMERDSDECSRYELEHIFSSAIEYSWGDSILTLLQNAGVGQSY